MIKNAQVKRLFKKILPSFAVKFLRKIDKSGLYFEYSNRNWNDAQAMCSGYNQENILAKVYESSQKVLAGEAVFERDSVLFYEEDFQWPLSAGLFMSAAQHKGRLAVLDFGGSLGSVYFQHKKLFENLSNFEWNVVEQDHFVKLGIDKFQ